MRSIVYYVTVYILNGLLNALNGLLNAYILNGLLNALNALNGIEQFIV